MIEIEVLIESGTGGHYDSDCCDLLVDKIKLPYIPQINSTISIRNEECIFKDYLVRKVRQWYINENKNGVELYVIPC